MSGCEIFKAIIDDYGMIGAMPILPEYEFCIGQAAEYIPLNLEKKFYIEGLNIFK